MGGGALKEEEDPEGYYKDYYTITWRDKNPFFSFGIRMMIPSCEVDQLIAAPPITRPCYTRSLAL